MQALTLLSNKEVFSLVVVVAFAVSTNADRKVTTLESGEFVASDLGEMKEIAHTHYETLLKRLKVADALKFEHKKLVATALSKDLEGVPLCSFDQEIEYRDETEKNETRHLTVHESGFLTDNKNRNKLFSEWKYSPFSAPPVVGIDLSSAKLVDEADSEITVQFQFDKEATSTSQSVTELLDNLKHVSRNLAYDLTIDAQSGGPKKLVLHLLIPTRVMLIAKVNKIRNEYVYSFDQNMQRFIITNQTLEAVYSALTRGTQDDIIKVTHSNFECPSPIRYVWQTSSSVNESSGSISVP